MRSLCVLCLLIIPVLVGASCTGEPGTIDDRTPTPFPIIAATTLAPLPTDTVVPTQRPTESLEPTAAPSFTPIVEDVENSFVSYEAPGDYLDRLTVSNLERYFVVHLPPQYTHGEAMPLVLNLHGRTSNTVQQRDASLMDQKADEEGFIVVYPQALGQPTTWFGVLFGEVGQPDMDFFAELISYLEERLSVDPARIYATGISNGATMVNRLGCEMSEVFAAIAPVAGAHSGLHLCEIEQPVSMLAIHGTMDNIIPYKGRGSDIPPVHTWVEAWAERDGCIEEATSERPYEDVLLESWEDCDEGAAVALYSVEGGGHTWLGLEYGPQSTRFNPDVGATDVIWDFFKAHPKMSLNRE